MKKTKIAWISRHEPLPAQKRALAALFNEYELHFDPQPFASAEEIAERIKNVGADECVVVAPLSVIQRLTELGIRPWWAEMKQIPARGPLNPDNQVEVAGRRYVFSRFRRIKRVMIEFEDEEEFIPVSQAAKMLGVSERNIYHLFRSKKLTKYKRLGKTLVRRQEVMSLLEPRND